MNSSAAKIEKGYEWDRRGRPPIVEVAWEDCETTAGWSELKEAAHLTARECVSVGYLLKWDKRGVWMIGGFSLSDKGEVSEVCEATVIPGTWIKVLRSMP